MLYPTMWEGANGFFHSLFYYPQIWPRYGHFLLASFAVSGFYLYFWNNRLQKKTNDIDEITGKMMQQGKRLGLQVMIGTTVLQFALGFILLFSFDRDIRMLYLGDDFLLTTLLVISLVTTAVLVYLLYLLMIRDKRKYFILSLSTFVLIIGVMGWMRHELRESYLNPYLDEVTRTTQVEEVETFVQDE